MLKYMADSALKGITATGDLGSPSIANTVQNAGFDPQILRVQHKDVQILFKNIKKYKAWKRILQLVLLINVVISALTLIGFIWSINVFGYFFSNLLLFLVSVGTLIVVWTYYKYRFLRPHAYIKGPNAGKRYGLYSTRNPLDFFEPAIFHVFEVLSTRLNLAQLAAVPDPDIAAGQEQANVKNLTAAAPAPKAVSEFLQYLLQALFSTETIQKAVRTSGASPSEMYKVLLHIANTMDQENTQEAIPSLVVKILNIALQSAIETDSYWVRVEHILLALIDILGAQDELATINISTQDLQLYIVYLDLMLYLKERAKIYSDLVPYIRKIGILDNWFTGFTFYISKFTLDITEQLKYKPGVYSIFHRNTLMQVIQALLQPESPHVLIVGDPGVGKSSVILGLGQLILEGNVPEPLKNRRILEIDANKFIANSKELGGPAMLMQYLEQELGFGADVILYIDQMERLLKDANLHHILLALLPLLEKYRVPLIGTVNTQFYNVLKKTAPNMLDYFEVISMPEPSVQETLKILLTKIDSVAAKYKIQVHMSALRKLVDYSIKYMPEKRLPKKAIEAFEKACVLAASQPRHILDISVVQKVFEQLIGAKLAVDTKDFAVNLMTLKQQIRKRYINQEQAVDTIVDAIVRNFAQLSDHKRPVGVFLFLGTTGVGKTYLAKIVSELLFRENYQIIRVDLGQYKTVYSIQTVIDVLSKIRLNPAALVLLDEFEKANPELHDIFLRLFDEGVIQDPQTGQELYFNNALIVATSNVGSDIILNYLKDLTDPKQVEKVFKQVQQMVLDRLFSTFKPELLNRFDSIVVFKPLSKKHLEQIARLMLKDLQKELAKQNIIFEFTDALVHRIVEKAYNPALGARPIRRYIDQVIKTGIAKYIIEYKAKYGTLPRQIRL